jgi:hypothetical protein
VVWERGPENFTRLAAYYSPLAGIMPKNVEMILMEADGVMVNHLQGAN